ncbi:MAG: N4-gp56 family major capsid protein [Sciscionella sp.]
MADAYTGTTALTNVIQAAVDQYVRAELRHTPLLRQVADTRPMNVDKPGSSIALYTHTDLAAVTSALSELSDPDAVALPDPTSVTLTPKEYGNATITSLKARATSFADVDPYQRDQIMWNLRDSLDALVAPVLNGGTNVFYGGTATSTDTVTKSMTISSALIRKSVAKLRGNAAQYRRGNLYWCGIHPDVSVDLRSETGSAAWRDSHQYAAPGVFWPGDIGEYEGAFFVESARMTVDTDGASSASVYRTLIAGREALAEGVVVEPEVRVGVVPDKLNRFRPMGWYGFLGWVLFRQKAIYRLETGSPLA